MATGVTARGGSRWVKAGLALAVAAAAGLLAVVVAETALAVADYPPANTDHQRLFVEYDSVRGWRNILNGRGRYVTPEFIVQMEYNARGYRGPIVEYAKPPGTYRVLLLGDSFLEGYTVALQDRVAEVAIEMFRQRPSGRPVEVVALGTGGYSTDQELLWLESEGIRYAPDLVVVLFCINDIWFNTQNKYPRGAKPVFRLAADSLVLTNAPVPRPAVTASAGAREADSPVQATKRFVRQHSRLVRLAERAVRRTAWLQGFGIRVGLLDVPAEVVQTARGAVTVPAEFVVLADSLPPQGDTALLVTAKLLTRMQERSRASGARFVVMLVPANEAVYPPGAPQSARFRRAPAVGDARRPSERFRDICARAQVRCLDPTPRFVAAAESLARRGDLIIFPEDGHWNEHGHRVAAAVLVDLVREFGWERGNTSARHAPGPVGAKLGPMRDAVVNTSAPNAGISTTYSSPSLIKTSAIIRPTRASRRRSCARA